MAWIPTTPENATVAGPPVTKAMDRYMIRRIEIDPNTPAIVIDLAKGYDDSGAFIEVTRSQIEVPSPKYVDGGSSELATAMLTMGNSSKTIRDNVRDASYVLLLAIGEIPEGASV